MPGPKIAWVQNAAPAPAGHILETAIIPCHNKRTSPIISRWGNLDCGVYGVVWVPCNRSRAKRKYKNMCTILYQILRKIKNIKLFTALFPGDIDFKMLGSRSVCTISRKNSIDSNRRSLVGGNCLPHLDRLTCFGAELTILNMFRFCYLSFATSLYSMAANSIDYDI